MTPQNFSHPLLASVRVPPQPAASLPPTTTVGDKADKGAADAKVAEAKPIETKTASADAVLELRSSVGHAMMSDATTGNAPAREEAATPATDAAAKTAEGAEAPKTATTEDKPADKIE